MLIIYRVAPFHGVLRARVPWYNHMGREPIVRNISGLPPKSSAYYGVCTLMPTTYGVGRIQSVQIPQR